MNFKKWLYTEGSTSEYWGPFSRVDDDGENLVVKADSLGQPLYIPKSATFTNVGRWPVGKALSPPWNKYFRYGKDPSGRNVVEYVENRAVDVVCYSRSHAAVYLINRKGAPVGLALPGGFFDNEADGFDANSPPDPATVGRKSAARELHEETGVSLNPDGLGFVGEFTTGPSDPREKVVKVWAYAYEVPEQMMASFRFGDDASQAPGGESMRKLGFKGWYKVAEIPGMAFPHHMKIIESSPVARL